MKLPFVALTLILLAGASGVGAYSGNRVALVPEGLTTPLTGTAGVALCERVTDDVALNPLSPLYCESVGLGAVFSDVGCAADFGGGFAGNGNGVPDNAAGCLDDLDGSPATDFGSDTDGKDAFATGTVAVNAFTTIAGTEAAWLVGNDRDDDGAVTGLDADGSNDDDCSVQESRVATGADCYDDEFITGVDNVLVGFVTPAFCFTHDRDFAGGDWDDVTVILGANVPPTPGNSPYVGTAIVSLSASSSAAACARSAHDDSLARFGGGPAPLPLLDDEVPGPHAVLVVKDPFAAPYAMALRDGEAFGTPVGAPRPVRELGCDVTAFGALGMTVQCPIGSRAGFWVCAAPTVVAAATAGTATGNVACAAGVAAIAASVAPVPAAGANTGAIATLTWTCQAGFNNAAASGAVLCVVATL